MFNKEHCAIYNTARKEKSEENEINTFITVHQKFRITAIRGFMTGWIKAAFVNGVESHTQFNNSRLS